MTGKIVQHDHMTSLRLPQDWHQWISDFADQWHVTNAYIYRSAIREFIQRKQQVHQ